MSHAVAVVLDLDDINAVKVGAGDGDGDHVGLGVESVPNQLGDTWFAILITSFLVRCACRQPADGACPAYEADLLAHHHLNRGM